MLKISGLDAFYGDSHILHAVSLQTGADQRAAVLGRNGAGKSTLLKSIMNAGPRTLGDISWDGRALGGTAAFRRARLGLCLVPEDRRVFGHLTVLENLAMARHAAPAGAPPPDPRAVLARFPLIAGLGERLGSQLSGGQQQLLAFARALAARPRLMLLDEPTEGLAPIIVEQLAKDVLAACESDKIGLLLCEQNIWFARQCTDFVHVLDAGRLVFSGSWAAFDADGDVKNRYLAM